MIPECGVPKCPDGNPLGYNCPTCKGFKQYGICSHVVAVNHLMKAINIDAMLEVLGEVPKKNRGGYNKGVRPALTREDAATARTRALERGAPDDDDDDDFGDTELMRMVRQPAPPHLPPPRARPLPG